MTRPSSDSEVRVEFVVDASAEKAYQVFTDGMNTWWNPDHHIGSGTLAEIVVEPHVGGRMFGRETDGTECPWGTVLTWNPPHRFAFSWDIGLNWEHEPDPARASRVEVTFTPAGVDRTTVTLVHSDLERHGPGWESMRDSVASPDGWPDLADRYAKAV